ncbi:MAG: ABC transporter ATP-binding protein [Candidatus Rokuibacteriota bacterium]|nr:MAG: ABC transporter ATP-binding protein [Candidatus Rokubacteria bacterium]
MSRGSSRPRMVACRAPMVALSYAQVKAGGSSVARIDLIDVCKTLKERGRHGSTFSIRNLSLRVPDGRTMVVLGPSGCGKTTLLKIIAGLIPPDSGDVRYDDVDVRQVRPGDRRIGMVFQSYALYPHLSSKANVLSYFLFRKKSPALDALAQAKYQRTSELMGVELADLLERKPATLSGGEKQRVALGRCITRDAAVFLVDEPFANLDQALREKYRVNLKILLRQFSITTVYVTHDHHEALILADLVAVMDRGRIEQVGTPEEIYDEPTNVFVAGFLNLHIGAPPISLVDADSMPQGERLGNARVGVRPEDVEISTKERENSLRGIVTGTLSLPPRSTTLFTIRVGEHELHAQTSGAAPQVTGDSVWLTFKRYHLFDKESGVRLRSHPERALR